MDAGLGVERSEVKSKRLCSGIDRYGGWVGGGCKAAVDCWFDGAKDERLGSLDTREGNRAASRDRVFLSREVLVGRKSDGGAGDVVIASEVEVGVVGQVDDGLISALDQCRFVLDAQNDDLLSVHHLVSSSVDDLGLDGAGIAFVTIFAAESELDAFTTLQAFYAGDFPDSNSRRAFPDALAPTLVTAVQAVEVMIVGCKRVRLAVEAVDFGVLDAVGNTADCLSEVR